jgi:hypothetical protein
MLKLTWPSLRSGPRSLTPVVRPSCRRDGEIGQPGQRRPEKHRRHHGTQADLGHTARQNSRDARGQLELLEPHSSRMSGPRRVRARSATWCCGRMPPTDEARAVGCTAPTGTAGRNRAGLPPHVGDPAVLPRGARLQGRPRGGMVSKSCLLQRRPLVELPSGSSARAGPRPVESERRTLGCRHATV